MVMIKKNKNYSRVDEIMSTRHATVSVYRINWACSSYCALRSHLFINPLLHAITERILHGKTIF